MSATAIGKYLQFSTAAKPRAAERVLHRERRATVRTSVHWPILFRHGHAELYDSVTENLSNQGFYCFLQSPVSLGEMLLCSLTVPTHDPSGANEKIVLECNVRIVRSDIPTEDGLYGIACLIEDYRFCCTDSPTAI
jgi:hypothetical protein